MNLSEQVAALTARLAIVEDGLQNSEEQMAVEQHANSTAWLYSCAFLLFTMQGGFALLESGMIAARFSINVLMKVTLHLAASAIAFFALGWALFGTSCPGSGGFIGCRQFMLIGMDTYLYITYFLGVAAIAPAIISGAVAGRMRFGVYIFLSFLVTGFIFPVAFHWSTSAHGFLANLGYYDFAAAGPLHVTAGTFGVVCSWLLGPRRGVFTKNGAYIPVRSNPTSAVFGSLVCFVGWLALHGSAGVRMDSGYDEVAALAATNSIVAVGGGVIAATVTLYMFSGWVYVNPFDIIIATQASVVSISACCSIVKSWEAAIIGAIGTVLCVYAGRLLIALRIDDPIGIFGSHCVSGAWSLIATGLFAHRTNTDADAHTSIAMHDHSMQSADADHLQFMADLIARRENHPFYVQATRDGLFWGGSAELLGLQLLGLVIYIAWGILWGGPFIILLQKLLGSIRVASTTEMIGADTMEHDTIVLQRQVPSHMEENMEPGLALGDDFSFFDSQDMYKKQPKGRTKLGSKDQSRDRPQPAVHTEHSSNRRSNQAGSSTHPRQQSRSSGSSIASSPRRASRGQRTCGAPLKTTFCETVTVMEHADSSGCDDISVAVQDNIDANSNPDADPSRKLEGLSFLRISADGAAETKKSSMFGAGRFSSSKMSSMMSSSSSADFGGLLGSIFGGEGESEKYNIVLKADDLYITANTLDQLYETEERSELEFLRLDQRKLMQSRHPSALARMTNDLSDHFEHQFAVESARATTKSDTLIVRLMNQYQQWRNERVERSKFRPLGELAEEMLRLQFVRPEDDKDVLNAAVRNSIVARVSFALGAGGRPSSALLPDDTAMAKIRAAASSADIIVIPADAKQIEGTVTITNYKDVPSIDIIEIDTGTGTNGADRLENTKTNGGRGKGAKDMKQMIEDKRKEAEEKKRAEEAKKKAELTCMAMAPDYELYVETHAPRMTMFNKLGVEVPVDPVEMGLTVGSTAAIAEAELPPERSQEKLEAWIEGRVQQRNEQRRVWMEKQAAKRLDERRGKSAKRVRAAIRSRSPLGPRKQTCTSVFIGSHVDVGDDEDVAVDDGAAADDGTVNRLVLDEPAGGVPATSTVDSRDELEAGSDSEIMPAPARGGGMDIPEQAEPTELLTAGGDPPMLISEPVAASEMQELGGGPVAMFSNQQQPAAPTLSVHAQPPHTLSTNSPRSPRRSSGRITPSPEPGAERDAATSSVPEPRRSSQAWNSGTTVVDVVDHTPVTLASVAESASEDADAAEDRTLLSIPTGHGRDHVEIAIEDSDDLDSDRQSKAGDGEDGSDSDSSDDEGVEIAPFEETPACFAAASTLARILSQTTSGAEALAAALADKSKTTSHAVLEALIDPSSAAAPALRGVLAEKGSAEAAEAVKALTELCKAVDSSTIEALDTMLAPTGKDGKDEKLQLFEAAAAADTVAEILSEAFASRNTDQSAVDAVGEATAAAEALVEILLEASGIKAGATGKFKGDRGDDGAGKKTTRKQRNKDGEMAKLAKTKVWTVEKRFRFFSKATQLDDMLQRFQDLLEMAGIGEDKRGLARYDALRTVCDYQLDYDQWFYFRLISNRVQTLLEDGKYKSCSGLKVVVCGAGPVGLRTALELAFLGADVTVVERHFTRNRSNITHLWRFACADLLSLGASEADCKGLASLHAPIKFLTRHLMRLALILGVKIVTGQRVDGIVRPEHPDNSSKVWMVKTTHVDSNEQTLLPASALVVACGAASGLPKTLGFEHDIQSYGEAYLISGSFENKNSEIEQMMKDCALNKRDTGASACTTKQLFEELKQDGLEVSTISYTQGNKTHHYMFSVSRKTLLDMGVMLKDVVGPRAIARSNVDADRLYALTRELATRLGLPPSCAFTDSVRGARIFDTTNRALARSSCKVLEAADGEQLAVMLAGDALQEAFFFEGLGINRGFLHAMDTAWCLQKYFNTGRTDNASTMERMHRSLFTHLKDIDLNSCNKQLRDNYRAFELEPTSRYKNVR